MPQGRVAHVKSKCDYFCESSHHVGFKSSLAHSLYMSEAALCVNHSGGFPVLLKENLLSKGQVFKVATRVRLF